MSMQFLCGCVTNETSLIDPREKRTCSECHGTGTVVFNDSVEIVLHEFDAVRPGKRNFKVFQKLIEAGAPISLKDPEKEYDVTDEDIVITGRINKAEHLDGRVVYWFNKVVKERPQ